MGWAGMAISGCLEKHLTESTLQHLYVWLTSEKTHERQRALHRCTSLFEFLNYKRCLSVSTSSLPPQPLTGPASHGVGPPDQKNTHVPASRLGWTPAPCYLTELHGRGV